MGEWFVPNKLINETSPYLLQHAGNPVDWYPWGEEAFEKAKKENKPVFLSIGYSACHWCHVMETESFGDEVTAKILNENFVSIKVDREERPDLDTYYMQAVSTLTGRGGWPLSVFLTPSKKPFYGGTYFPKEPRPGLPSFVQVLIKISELYKSDSGRILENAEKLSEALQEAAETNQKGEISLSILDDAAVYFQNSFDSVHGGLSGGPKFPQAPIWEFLLTHTFTSKDVRFIPLVSKTLNEMAKGGIYDQVGGGFFRYATDNKWLVPHFEKMLYDQAQLILLYLHAYQITRNGNYKRIIEESFSYLERELRDAGGAFYSSQNADSEGVEGKYYLWDYEGLKYEFSEGELKILETEFGLGRLGNFEGENILRRRSLEDSPQIKNLKQKLLALRQKRIKPSVDDKIIVSWNGLLIIALATAFRVLKNNYYQGAAETAANFIWNNLFQNDKLHHSLTKGKIGRPGFSDDYAAFALANLTLFETTGKKSWLEKTFKITHLLRELFWDEENGGVHHAAIENMEAGLPRDKDFDDNPSPSGNSLLALLFAKLRFLTEKEEYRKMLAQIISQKAGQLLNVPAVYGSMLTAAELYFAKPLEIAVVAKTEKEIEPFLNVIYDYYLPTAVIAAKLETDPENLVPLLEGRTTKNNKAQIYICENFACKSPLDSVEDVKTQLQLLSL